mmetsp:Transcript_29776/g.91382  ORF Transcript_29776/g.91382 Transcript_29776/m.91382 type:complete len:81 (-) Transcript_29776:21-263(-)
MVCFAQASQEIGMKAEKRVSGVSVDFAIGPTSFSAWASEQRTQPTRASSWEDPFRIATQQGSPKLHLGAAERLRDEPAQH